VVAEGGKQGKIWKILKGHHNAVYTVAYSPQGTIITSGSYGEAARLWDVRSGNCMKTLPAHSDPVSGVGFDRDGTMIVSCSHDGLIGIWDVITGQCLRTLVEEDNKGEVRPEWEVAGWHAGFLCEAVGLP